MCLRHWIISLSLWSLLTKVRAAAYKDLVQHWLDICHCNLQLKQKKLKQIPTSVTANYYNNILNIDEWRNKTEPKGTRQTPQKYWLVYLNMCQSYALNVAIMSESEKTTITFSLMRRCCSYLGRVWSGSLRYLDAFMRLVQKGKTDAGCSNRNSYKSGGTTHVTLTTPYIFMAFCYRTEVDRTCQWKDDSLHWSYSE